MDEKKEIDRINSLSEDEVRLIARLRTMDIQCELEKKAKRIKPSIFIPYALTVFNDPSKKLLGLHWLLQVIEANCAYHKNGYDEEITWNKFANIFNLNRRIEDENDFHLWTIHHRIGLFFQFIARMQLEVQHTGSNKPYISRYWKLFYANDFTPQLFDNFFEKFGISIEKWFLCSICMFSVFQKSYIGSSNIKVPPGINVNLEDISRYLNLSVYSVEEIRQKYFDIRNNTPREFHFLIRSTFIERPIVKFDNNRIVAPIPELIFHHMGYKLREMFEEIDVNDHCFADSFEEYTKIVLSNYASLIKLYSSNELERLLWPDKSCDFLLITPAENILIECKAVDLRVKTLTEAAIYKCNAFSKIQRAIIQINTTLKNINEKDIVLEELNKNKPFLKVIVTFGEMFGFNSEWILSKLLSGENLDIKNLSENTKTIKPLIISIEGLEKLIVYLESSGKSLIEIYNAKQEQGYLLTGDWDVFLTNELNKLDKIKELNFIDTAFNEIFERLGIKE